MTSINVIEAEYDEIDISDIENVGFLKWNIAEDITDIEKRVIN